MENFHSLLLCIAMARAIVWERVAQSEEELEKEPQEQQAVAVEEEELKGEPADVVKDEDLELEKEPREQQADAVPLPLRRRSS